mmetsp:Transcript_17885/g.27101  ORF Transcript_17885/g.27101 Transcript_17885/m.27101 type:complete len:303 (-) Transcript_17885:178-1086(-)
MIFLIGIVLCRSFLLYFASCFVLALLPVYQEYKIWKPNSLPSLSYYGMLKVYGMNVVWTTGCLLGSVLLLPKLIFTGTVEKEAHEIVERTMAHVCIAWFVGPVVVKNAEKLPPPNPGAPAPIYICNHASQIDVAAIYNINRRFKWIAKSSVRLLPGVGQIMTLSKHVWIDRRRKKSAGTSNSVSNLYEKSNQAIQSGCPMFFFPQGTRRMSERLKFKDGALNVALQNKAALIPLSIEIPRDAWNRVYPFTTQKFDSFDPIIITVHDAIEVKGNEDKDELRKRCTDTIYSVLPEINAENKKDK